MARRRRSGFTWDATSSRFRRRSSGQFLSRRVVIRTFEFAINRNRREMRAVSEQLRDGEISIRQWQREVARRLKDAHLYAAASARGGRLEAPDFGRIGRLVRDRYEYLAKFGADIASGKQPINGRFLVRADAYILHARQARFEAERVEMAEVQGYTHEQNRLNAFENCVGCTNATMLGRVPIGTLPPIGTRDCLAQCKCEVVFS